jgi:hypothetical protein
MFLDLVLTADHAGQILEAWKTRALHARRQITVDGVDLNGTAYAVELENIIGMHTFPVAAQKPNAPYGSGGRN